MSEPIHKCSECHQNLTYPCFGRLQNDPTYCFPEKWCKDCFTKVEKEHRSSKAIGYVKRFTKGNGGNSYIVEGWEGDHIFWKVEKGCWITEWWEAEGVRKEKEIYRPVGDDDPHRERESNFGMKYPSNLSKRALV